MSSPQLTPYIAVTMRDLESRRTVEEEGTIGDEKEASSLLTRHRPQPY